MGGSQGDDWGRPGRVFSASLVGSWDDFSALGFDLNFLVRLPQMSLVQDDKPMETAVAIALPAISQPSSASIDFLTRLLDKKLARVEASLEIMRAVALAALIAERVEMICGPAFGLPEGYIEAKLTNTPFNHHEFLTELKKCKDFYSQAEIAKKLDAKKFVASTDNHSSTGSPVRISANSNTHTLMKLLLGILCLLNLILIIIIFTLIQMVQNKDSAKQTKKHVEKVSPLPDTPITIKKETKEENDTVSKKKEEKPKDMTNPDFGNKNEIKEQLDK